MTVAAPRIVVVGSANMDLVGVAERLPLPGETVLGDEFVMMAGGKGANQAIAAARAGGRAVFLGAIGSDSFGVTLSGRLGAAGVDTAHVRTSYGASGVAVIMVDRAGENSILVAPGANKAFVDLTATEEAVIAGGDVLLCQLEIPVGTVIAATRAARAGGTRTILNAAPACVPATPSGTGGTSSLRPSRSRPPTRPRRATPSPARSPSPGARGVI